ncbi:MAG: cobalamin biosynthesis protein [Clostridiales bacterium]|jgi:cobalt-precorrin 5A hydrolase|nr:cobalamin biosynthesis protein [Clostridiales bacterium]
MTAAIICFSDKGCSLGKRVKAYFDGAALTRCPQGGLDGWTRENFDRGALIFISSCGIAVRAIAPYLKSKTTDPAVVVIDEHGKHAVSLLSGHMGGANALTAKLAAHIGAEAVITTASASVFMGAKPADIPAPAVTLGIGCRKGAEVETVIARALDKANCSLKALKRVCSIDLKAKEPSLLAFCGKHNLPFVTFTAQELAETQGTFSKSDFVESATGVDNVCERAAVRGSGGFLILPKYAENGVTVALAVERCE